MNLLEVELLHHVNMKHKSKKFLFDYLLASLCIIFQPNHFPQLVYIITKYSVGVMENLCLKCHVHDKLTGLRRVYVGIGPLVCIINLVITPVANVLMRLGCQGKGTENFSWQ